MRKIFSYILAVLLLLNICPNAYAEAQGTLAGWSAPAHDHTSKEGNITLDNTYAKSGSYSAKAYFGLPYKANRYLTFSTQVTVKKGAKTHFRDLPGAPAAECVFRGHADPAPAHGEEP